MAERVRVREITNEEGNRLLRIVRRSSGSVVTWRRAQMVLLSAQGMDEPAIAKVAFTSEDRVRAVIHNFNADGFESLYPRYAGGRPPTFTLPQRREIKKLALKPPQDHDLPFSTWSLSKLAEFLVAEGVVDDISHEGLRALLREEGVSFQALKTWKQSNDPDFEAKKNRILELYDIADGKAEPGPGDPEVVICVDHLLGAYDLSTDRLYGHIKARKGRSEFLSFCRYLRSLHPPDVRIAIVLDNWSPHHSTKKDTRVGDWAAANTVEFAYVPFYASWLNRIQAQFTALRYFCIDGTDHDTRHDQSRMIRRYIAWRNRNPHDRALREIVKRANVA